MTSVPLHVAGSPSPVPADVEGGVDPVDVAEAGGALVLETAVEVTVGRLPLGLMLPQTPLRRGRSGARQSTR